MAVQQRYRLGWAVPAGWYRRWRLYGGLPQAWVPAVQRDTGLDQPRIDVVAGGTPIHLEIKLEPFPKISGRVLDAGGKPVANAEVWALAGGLCPEPRCYSALVKAKTNAKGEYAIENLGPFGPWVISATAPAGLAPPDPVEGQRTGWAQTFYPGVADLQVATQVNPQPGVDRDNVDIKLVAAPVHRVRGRVLDPGGEPAAGASVVIGNGLGPSLQQQAKPDGTFEFAALTDGDWRASVVPGPTHLLAGRGFHLDRRDLDGVDLRLAAAFPLHAKLVWKGADGAPAPEPPDTVLDPTSGPVHLDDDAHSAIGERDDGGLVFEAV